MELGVTLHTGGGDETKVVYPVVEHMDKYLKDKLKNVDYGGGINDFLIKPYVVFSDEIENAEFAKPSHKVQRSKDYYGDKKWFKTIVFALPFNPDVISKMSLENFRIVLCEAVLKSLQNPEMKILKAFDYESFKEDMTKIIKKYREEINIS